MEYNYLWLLNYNTAECIVIKLTKEDKELINNYDNFETFIADCLEEKYNFNLNDCQWMVSENYEFTKFGF